MSPELDRPELDGAAAPGGSHLLGGGTPRRGGQFPLTTIVVAGAVVLAILAAVLFFTRSQSHTARNAVQPLDPYAADLPLSALGMSESESLSGGKSTFLDGRIRNNGTSTVTGVTVQVFFRNEESLPPAVETLPVTLIRTRQPYVDTEPVAADPLKPGDEREFRLIFEALPHNWNTQLPEVHVTHVAVR